MTAAGRQGSIVHAIGTAVAGPDTDGDERARQLVGPRLERGVREPLITEDHRLGVWMRPRHLVQQVAECPAHGRHGDLDYSLGTRGARLPASDDVSVAIA